jgi:hypothetical protein
MRYFVVIVLLVQSLFCVSIVTRFLTKQLLIDRGVENGFTRFVVHGAEDVILKDSQEPPNMYIEYLRNQCNGIFNGNDGKKNKFDFLKKITVLRGHLQGYTTNALLFRQTLLRWSVVFSLHQDTRKLGRLPDGYYYEAEEMANMRLLARKFGRFKSMLDSIDIPFLLVIDPSKYPAQSKQNIDSFLWVLDSLEIWHLNLADKQPFGIEGFYKTDHHWKIETALWSASEVAKEINKKLSYRIDTRLYDTARIERVLFPKMYMGSFGRRLFLPDSAREDFEELWPKYPTHFVNLTTDGEQIGDFKTAFGVLRLTAPNDVKSNSDFYANLMQSFKAHNLDSRAVPKSILVAGSSYAIPLAAFLSLGVQYVAEYDNHSVNQCSMEALKPDLLILEEGSFYFASRLANIILGDF